MKVSKKEEMETCEKTKINFLKILEWGSTSTDFDFVPSNRDDVGDTCNDAHAGPVTKKPQRARNGRKKPKSIGA